MKKILTLVLAGIFCMMSAGCSGEDTPQTDGTAIEGNDNDLIIVANGESEFSIQGEKELMSDIEVRQVVESLSNAIADKTGAKLLVSSDRYYKEENASKPAILIGRTEFAESEAASATESNQFRIEISGNKLLILAEHKEGYKEAIKQFIEKIVDQADATTKTLIFREDQVFSGEYTVEQTETDAPDSKLDSLKGLTVNILGDSYLKGQTLPEGSTWPGLLAKKYDWTLNNYAVNGCALASGSGCPYGTPIAECYDEMPNNNADVIIFDGGRNDYSYNVPIGTVDSTDPTTYMGAMNVIINGLKEKYPNAVIIFTTVWNFPDTNSTATGKGITYLDYAQAAETVCAAKGVYCFKAYDPSFSGIDMRSVTFRAQYCLNKDDISHLNLDGMKLVMPKYEAFIAASLADASSKVQAN